MKYLIRIMGKRISCTGEEVYQFINSIHTTIKDLTWYGADVSFITKNPDEHMETLEKLEKLEYARAFVKIGSTEELLDIANRISQFTSGVFVVIDEDLELSLRKEVYTDDEFFADMGQSTLEFRCFDVHAIEIITARKNIVDLISRSFSVLPEEID